MPVEPLRLLDKCPIGMPAHIERLQDEYVLCLGERIHAKDRSAFRPLPHEPTFHTAGSGSVGFMTFSPDRPYHSGVLFVYKIGVEAGHERQGHCARMLRWSEIAARKLDAEVVAVANVISPRMRDIVSRNGYEKHEHYVGTWVKKVRW